MLRDADTALPPLLDTRAGEWPREQALRLAAVARRCIEMLAGDRCTVHDVLEEVDALAGRDAAMPGYQRADSEDRGFAFTYLSRVPSSLYSPGERLLQLEQAQAAKAVVDDDTPSSVPDDGSDVPSFDPSTGAPLNRAARHLRAQAGAGAAHKQDRPRPSEDRPFTRL